MSEELQQKLRDQLWEVANKLRGNMSASDFISLWALSSINTCRRKSKSMPTTH